MNAPRLVETDRGATVFAANRYLYSRRSPVDRPARIAGETPVLERCLYVIPSPLLGYGLDVLAGRIPESSRILALETSQELFGLCCPSVSADLLNHPRITWARLDDIESLHAVVREIGLWRFRRIRRVDLNAGADLDAARYSEFLRFLHSDLENYWRNRHALGRFGRHWIRHLLANLADIAMSEDVFRPITDYVVPGIPVVVGAGPSLDAGIPFLRDNRSRLTVLAADTALPALLGSGIRPDAVVVLETQSWNLLDFHGAIGSGIPVMADITAYPGTLRGTGGPCYLFSSTFADLNALDRLETAGARPPSIPALGSVGLAAVDIALSSPAPTVLVTGLDFCYAPAQSHARGSSVHRWQTYRRRRLEPHPGFERAMGRPRTEARSADGRRVTTDAVLSSYADLFRDRFAASGRLRILEPGGIDLGVPMISASEAAGLSPSPGRIRRCDGITGPNPDGARSFLAEESAGLKEAIAAWDAYAGGAGRADQVGRALQGLDEIFCDFPDEPPLPKTDDAFLVRAIRRCRAVLRYLERVGAVSR